MHHKYYKQILDVSGLFQNYQSVSVGCFFLRKKSNKAFRFAICVTWNITQYRKICSLTVRTSSSGLAQTSFFSAHDKNSHSCKFMFFASLISASSFFLRDNRTWSGTCWDAPARDKRQKRNDRRLVVHISMLPVDFVFVTTFRKDQTQFQAFVTSENVGTSIYHWKLGVRTGSKNIIVINVFARSQTSILRGKLAFWTFSPGF